MNRYFDNHFQRDVVTIYPGEFYSTKENEMISTVLGSCVSIVLYDTKSRVGGINHFMLAKDSSLKSDFETDENKRLGKFGEYAIDLLIEDLKKNGAVLANLEAKVFGGGNIFNLPDVDAQVGNVNSKFAFSYLEKLNIPVVKSNTGGILPRKIFFDPETQKVFMKFIDNRHVQNADGKVRQPEPRDDFIERLGKQEEELESEIKKSVFAGMKIELKAVKNLFEDED